MEATWKENMLYYIRDMVDPSLDEEDNYQIIVTNFESPNLDPSELTEEDVKELGGSTKFAKRLVEQYDDLSDEEQNKVWHKAEELIQNYEQLLMDEEEEWVRSKIRRTIRKKTA
jgi:hypothetical protein